MSECLSVWHYLTMSASVPPCFSTMTAHPNAITGPLSTAALDTGSRMHQSNQFTRLIRKVDRQTCDVMTSSLGKVGWNMMHGFAHVGTVSFSFFFLISYKTLFGFLFSEETTSWKFDRPYNRSKPIDIFKTFTDWKKTYYLIIFLKTMLKWMQVF